MIFNSKTQNPVVAIPYRFDPDHRHQKISRSLDEIFFIQTEAKRRFGMSSHRKVCMSPRHRRVRQHSHRVYFRFGLITKLFFPKRQVMGDKIFPFFILYPHNCQFRLMFEKNHFSAVSSLVRAIKRDQRGPAGYFLHIAATFEERDRLSSTNGKRLEK